ncbi:MAG: hypothetical protein ABFD00_03815 [Chloroherpetonaceae bacterium]
MDNEKEMDATEKQEKSNLELTQNINFALEGIDLLRKNFYIKYSSNGDYFHILIANLDIARHLIRSIDTFIKHEERQNKETE